MSWTSRSGGGKSAPRSRSSARVRCILPRTAKCPSVRKPQTLAQQKTHPNANPDTSTQSPGINPRKLPKGSFMGNVGMECSLLTDIAGPGSSSACI